MKVAPECGSAPRGMVVRMAEDPGGAWWARHLDETLEGAAALVSSYFHADVGLEIQDSFRPVEYRATVMRCRVVGAATGGDIPSTVIVKRFRGDTGIGTDTGTGGGYDPDDHSPTGSRARFLNEWAGTTFLSSVGASFGPVPYAGDNQLGLVVLEDLGDGECLADRLQGDDRVEAERALLAYATTLGRMHAATMGEDKRYAAMRRELAGEGAKPPGADMVRAWLSPGLADFREACDAIHLPISAACATELTSLEDIVAEPGPFLAFSVGDTCPDNHRYVRGATDSVRFYDMEFGGFQHALLDAAYLWMPFSTCWCVARLPDELPPRLEAAYRAELVRGCPAASDHDVFGRAMTEACATWFVLTVAWSLRGVLERDDQWGISTVRQRFPLRATNFARVARRSGHLPHLSALAERLAERLRAMWGEEADMPLYQPFREPVRAAN